jgi:hypothetical protein
MTTCSGTAIGSVGVSIRKRPSGSVSFRKAILLIHDCSRPNGGKQRTSPCQTKPGFGNTSRPRVQELLIEAQSSVPVQHHCLDEPAQLSHRFVDQELAFSQNLEFGILGQ